MANIHMVWDESGLLAHYLSDRLDMPLGPNRGGFIFYSKDRLVGAITLYDFRENGTTRQASLVGAAETARWFTKKNFRDVCRMFFMPAPDGMGLTRLNSFVTVDNDRSLAFTKHIGFKEEGRLRRAGPDGQDVTIFGMLPDGCPWLAQEDDREELANNNPAKPDEQEG